MSDANKRLVERLVDEFWNQGNLAALDELMAPDAAIHLPTGESVDPAGLKQFAVAWRAAFPDWHATTEEFVAEGDRVAERWTGRGTHRGELQGFPPTGKHVVAQGSVFYRIDGGRIADFHGQFDVAGLFQQLGATAAGAR
jgi:steroid delta-isomerase-like uncharacterized protein